MSQVAVQHSSGQAIFFKAFAAAVRPRDKMTVSQWADKHRILTSKSSEKKGPWRTSLVPYMKEPMDCLSVNSTVQEVTMMKPTQAAATEVALNWIGYVMDHAPAPMLYVMPTLETRKRFVTQRLNPLLIDTQVLAEKFDAKRSRDMSNREDIKDYPGGILILSGANSPASLAMMPIKYVVKDEYDRFPWQVKKEGDPGGLIDERQGTFTRRKTLNISSPTVDQASRIAEKYEESDQRQYYMPCPHCDEKILFKWKNLQWDRAYKNAWYVCYECGSVIEEHEKTKMLKLGKWVPKYPERSHLHRGYHWNGLYAPIGLGFRWIERARHWKKAQGDNTKLKRFVNTVLAETWKDTSRDIQAEVLAERAEPYKLRQIPPGCLIITMSIDVQDDRLELMMAGWGRRETCWILDYHVITGEPAMLLEQARQGEGPLIDYINKPLENSFGRKMKIQAVAIDSGGHYTHEVYNFARSGQAMRLMAIKGSHIPNKPILVQKPKLQDVNWKGKVIAEGVKLYTVGTDTAKNTLTNRLLNDENLEPSKRKMHFSQDLPIEFYKQLTAEVYDIEEKKWKLRSGRRNEALDLWVYVAAAAYHPEIRVHALRKADWDHLELLLEPKKAEPDKDGKPAIALPPPKPKKGRRVRSPGIKR